MSARKLQQEFDKVNKKIAEGLAAFDDTKEKMQNCEVPSQRDKLENDLKKELKKLQRSRDQLKIWLGDSGIKLDKSLLQENRTKIEHSMDIFKELEKSSKIKQFSNEGLELQRETKKSSRFGDVEKLQEACDYITGVIEQLTNQNDELDQELDSLGAQSKKKGGYSVQSSIEDIKYKIDRNNTHVEKLEEVLDNLENDRLDPAKIDDIKDDLDYYVEMNQDEDYVEYDEFYDQLEVADDEEEELEVEGSLAQMAAESFEEEERKRLELQQLGQQQSEATRASQSSASSSIAPPAHQVKSGSVSSSSDAHSHGHSNTAATSAKAEISANGTTTTTTPVKKAKAMNVVPAPPPPITNTVSYSSVIKAAQAAGTSEANATSSNHTSSSNNTPKVNNNVPLATALGSTASGTPSKAPPPGFGQPLASVRSQSASPLTSESNLNDIDQRTTQPLKKKLSNTSQTSLVSNYDSGLGDSFNLLMNITSSRLNDPLPIQSIGNLLESSLLNCPDSFDAEKPRQYVPQNVHPSSVDYPQEPMFELNSAHYMQKFDDDTLFFCFYYSESIDNFAKYNAANELTKRGWVFNTEVGQWFSKKDTKPSGSKRLSMLLQKEDSLEPQGESNGNAQFKKYFDEKTWLVRNANSKKV
ncbi:Not5 protein [Candida orthopsilosis Co 90-125]|uniref:General negative regulator of transcription subunit n=1 Tax=Candida orthopsilosis (strain 90-125) TaxID=1136231 RepID=H8WXR4_CANO9|nr:Not5 protein [Candida orthopsilosis Co 90-125]CCG20861.1 Not5 protein [Candida orthopsilosis Co 90-125]